MTGPDAPQNEMAELRFRSGPGVEPEEPLLDRILDGYPLPPDAPPVLHTLAAGLSDLAGPAGPGALIGEKAALAAFRQVAGHGATSPARAPLVARRAAPQRRLDRRRRPLLAAVRVRLAALSTVAAIAVGGTAAAYAGVLPAALQNFAHSLIGAPSRGNGPNSQLPGHPQPTVSPGSGTSGAAGYGSQPGPGSASSGTGRAHQPGRPTHSIAPTPRGKSRRPGSPRPSARPSPSTSATSGVR
jgi:hypothetical protein